MNYRHAAWRKLYLEESGDFASLPWFTRAAAVQLLRMCDDLGRISIGPPQPGETVARALARTVSYRMGGTPVDRRQMVKVFPLLFQEGYLVHRAPYVVIRNFVIAQRRQADDNEAPGHVEHTPSPTHGVPIPDPSSTHGQPMVDPSSTYGVPIPSLSSTHGQPMVNLSSTYGGNEQETKQELSERKHKEDDTRAPARARSSVLSSSVPSSTEKRRVESGSEDVVVAGTDPVDPPPGASSPSPDSILPGAGADTVKHVLELWDTVELVRVESKNKIMMTVLGTAAASLQALLDDLAAQGWGHDDFVAWARYAAAGEDDWWVGPYTTAALVGKPSTDGVRSGGGLLRCLEMSRARRRKPANGAHPKNETASKSLMDIPTPEDRKLAMDKLKEMRERLKAEQAKNAKPVGETISASQSVSPAVATGNVDAAFPGQTYDYLQRELAATMAGMAAKRDSQGDRCDE